MWLPAKKEPRVLSCSVRLNNVLSLTMQGLSPLILVHCQDREISLADSASMVLTTGQTAVNQEEVASRSTSPRMKSDSIKFTAPNASAYPREKIAYRDTFSKGILLFRELDDREVSEAIASDLLVEAMVTRCHGSTVAASRVTRCWITDNSLLI
jgi:hypothetical protein